MMDSFNRENVKINQLPNGLTIATWEMPWERGVYASLRFRSGSRQDPQGREGLAHFLEHMLINSIPGRPYQNLIQEYSARSGMINAATSSTFTEFVFELPGEFYLTGLRDICAMATAPTNSPEEIEKQRRIITEEKKRDHREAVSALYLNRLRRLYPTDRVCANVLGELETIAEIGQRDLEVFHNDHFTAANAHLVVAGNVSHDEVCALALELLGNLPEGERNYQLYNRNLDASPCDGVILSNYFNNGASKLQIVYPLIAFGTFNREYAAIECFRRHLDNTLCRVVREERQMTYHVGATLGQDRDFNSVFIIEADCTNENLPIILQVIDETTVAALHNFDDTYLQSAKNANRFSNRMAYPTRLNNAKRLGHHVESIGDLFTDREDEALYDSMDIAFVKDRLRKLFSSPRAMLIDGKSIPAGMFHRQVLLGEDGNLEKQKIGVAALMRLRAGTMHAM